MWGVTVSRKPTTQALEGYFFKGIREFIHIQFRLRIQVSAIE